MLGESVKEKRDIAPEDSKLKGKTYGRFLDKEKLDEKSITFPVFPKAVNNWVIQPVALGQNFYITNGKKHSRYKKKEEKEIVRTMSDIVYSNQEKYIEEEKRCMTEGHVKVEDNVEYVPEQKEEINRMYMYNSAGAGKWGVLAEQESNLERASVNSEKSKQVSKEQVNNKDKWQRSTWNENNKGNLENSLIEQSY